MQLRRSHNALRPNHSLPCPPPRARPRHGVGSDAVVVLAVLAGCDGDDMNAQEIFDTVVAHLRKQGKRAMDVDKCQYRTDAGLKCAVGCLIPDDVYSDDMEGENAEYVVEEFASVLPHLTGHEVLLNRLQVIHDSRHSWSETGFHKNGEHNLINVASDFGLTYTPPTATVAL